MFRRPLAALVLLLGLAAPALAQSAQRVPGQVVTGVAVDATGAVLPNAQVVLSTPGNVTVQTGATDAAGTFRFEGVPPGRYDLRVAFEGFQTATARVAVGGRPPAAVRVTLPLANVTQEITVTNQAAEVAPEAGSNSDAVTVDANMLESLPVFDQDLVATISRFLDAGSFGNGGLTVVVNGMEVSALRVSASAVQQIKINQDPYSAEYARPGRGRIEILTKPGSQEYHGEVNAIGRNATFDAKNAFATTEPADEKHIFEGVFGGPMGHGGKTSFLLSAHDQSENQQVFVHAVGLAGAIEGSALQPNRQSLVAGSITRQKSDATTISVRANYEYEHNGNRGVGGTTLASAGTDFEHREEQLTYTQQTTIHQTLLAQVQILVGHEREPTVSASVAPSIVVAGAFTGGGAQGDLLRTETHTQATASLAWTKGAHLVQAGFQVPDWSQRGFDDRTNFGGTFSFSNLLTYAAGQPYSFTAQAGNGVISLLEKQVGAYIKDDWRAAPGLTVSLGMRYDWQNYFHDDNNVAPRLSVAYAPGAGKTTVLRAGAGVFNDRSGPVVVADVLNSRPEGLTRYIITDPSYPDPFRGAGAAAQPTGIVQLAPDVQIPQTLQYSAGLDHQLSKTVTLSVTYTGSQGHHLFRSRDINAPLPPLYVSRPNAAYSSIRQVESNGRQKSNLVSVNVHGRVGTRVNGQIQYALGRVDNDTNGIAWFPANDYDLSGEYARADFDQRQRLALLGSLKAWSLADVGLALTMNSGGPYTALLGADIFNNGRGHARPDGIARNTLQRDGYASLDLRVSRDLSLGKSTPQARALTLGFDAFNLTNRVNYAGYVGTVSSPLFLQPVSARPARQLQFSIRFKF